MKRSDDPLEAIGSMPERESEHERKERERKMNARAHRQLGTLATVLVILAVVVALARMRTMFAISPWQALGLGASGMPWVLLILILGIVLGLGATRVIEGVMWVVNRVRGKKAGQ